MASPPLATSDWCCHFLSPWSTPASAIRRKQRLSQTTWWTRRLTSTLAIWRTIWLSSPWWLDSIQSLTNSARWIYNLKPHCNSARLTENSSRRSSNLPSLLSKRLSIFRVKNPKSSWISMPCTPTFPWRREISQRLWDTSAMWPRLLVRYLAVRWILSSWIAWMSRSKWLCRRDRSKICFNWVKRLPQLHDKSSRSLTSKKCFLQRSMDTLTHVKWAMKLRKLSER